MKINIQTPGFAPRRKLIDLVHKKINQLALLHREIISSEVCLQLSGSFTKDNKICRIRLFIPGNDLLASTQYEKFEQSIVQAVEKLKKQIIKRKTKITGRRKNIPNI